VVAKEHDGLLSSGHSRRTKKVHKERPRAKTQSLSPAKFIHQRSSAVVHPSEKGKERERAREKAKCYSLLLLRFTVANSFVHFVVLVLLSCSFLEAVGILGRVSLRNGADCGKSWRLERAGNGE
jgi:hypothetical protein